MKFVRAVETLHAKTRAEGGHHLHLHFLWRGLMDVMGTQDEKARSWANVIAVWRQARAVLGPMMWTFMAASGSTTAVADQFVQVDAGHGGVKGSFLTEDEYGVVACQNWKPGTARPSNGVKRMLVESATVGMEID